MDKKVQAKLLRQAAEELYELIKELNILTQDQEGAMYGFESCYKLMVVASEIERG